jgi:hypothetical protein
VDAVRQRLEQLRDTHERIQNENGGEERSEDIRRHIAQTERQLAELLRDRRDEDQRHEEHQQHEERERHEEREEHQRHEDHQRHPEHNEGMERLERMHAAADHLSKAGLHEIAEQVIHHAEEFERDLHRHQPRPEDSHQMMREMREQLDGLRREVGQLREQVERLRRERN